ncbi:MAG: hypothetical protein R6V86_04880 [Spirochaetia bacterium]
MNGTDDRFAGSSFIGLWYDSLILASALQSKAKLLYTEDLQHDRVYRGIRILNPFLRNAVL